MAHYTIGASQVRKRLQALPMKERETLLKLLWPDIPSRHLHLFSAYPDELSINGSQLGYPASWDAFKG